MIIQFQPQGFVGWLADMLMLPIMFFLQGTLKESPQRTHRWNNHKFQTESELALIKLLPKISFKGIPSEKSRWLGFLPRFHMPILGGWKKFVVLVPVTVTEKWFIGWHPTDGDSAGVSMIPLSGPVRVTIGDSDVEFFALSRSGVPLNLIQIGEGYIGHAGEFANIPLR
jgi:hypothetical protein